MTDNTISNLIESFKRPYGLVLLICLAFWVFTYIYITNLIYYVDIGKVSVSKELYDTFVNLASLCQYNLFFSVMAFLIAPQIYRWKLLPEKPELKKLAYALYGLGLFAVVGRILGFWAPVWSVEVLPVILSNLAVIISAITENAFLIGVIGGVLHKVFPESWQAILIAALIGLGAAFYHNWLIFIGRPYDLFVIFLAFFTFDLAAYTLNTTFFSDFIHLLGNTMAFFTMYPMAPLPIFSAIPGDVGYIGLFSMFILTLYMGVKYGK